MHLYSECINTMIGGGIGWDIDVGTNDQQWHLHLHLGYLADAFIQSDL